VSSRIDLEGPQAPGCRVGGAVSLRRSRRYEWAQAGALAHIDAMRLPNSVGADTGQQGSELSSTRRVALRGRVVDDHPRPAFCELSQPRPPTPSRSRCEEPPPGLRSGLRPGPGRDERRRQGLLARPRLPRRAHRLGRPARPDREHARAETGARSAIGGAAVVLVGPSSRARRLCLGCRWRICHIAFTPDSLRGPLPDV
jgi:hypothetical protein